MDSAPAASPRSVTWARVGFQGELGAYSEEVALAILPEAVTIGYPTFTRAFDALSSREVDAAVLPVENSLGGSRGQRCRQRRAARRYGLKILMGSMTAARTKHR